LIPTTFKNSVRALQTTHWVHIVNIIQSIFSGTYSFFKLAIPQTNKYTLTQNADNNVQANGTNGY